MGRIHRSFSPTPACPVPSKINLSCRYYEMDWMISRTKGNLQLKHRVITDCFPQLALTALGARNNQDGKPSRLKRMILKEGAEEVSSVYSFRG